MGSKLEAVESLMDLGLTEYEARCFVALTQLSEATAKEISRIADVPQSRVYDIADQLHKRGVVDVQESDPRKYYMLPLDDALERLRREYDRTLETAAEQLEDLEVRDTDGGGVWGIADEQGVVERLAGHLEDATEEIYVVFTGEDLAEDDVLEGLQRAADRGVTVYVEVPDEALRERVDEAVPAAEVLVSDLPLESVAVDDCRAGRLALIDGDTVLVSALHEGLVPGERAETGLWSSDVGNGVVVWVRTFLERRLEEQGFDRD